jgi:hypothetical protein
MVPSPDPVLHTWKNCLGHPLLLTELRRKCRQAQYFFGSYNDPSIPWDLTAQVVELVLHGELHANKARPECHGDKEHRYR